MGAFPWDSIPLATMRLVFRADASTSIGSGHVMRLTAIAEEAISRGFECIFVGETQEVEWLSLWVSRVGFSKIVVPANFEPQGQTDLLILDSYLIERNDIFIQLHRWLKVVVIADELTPNYEANLIIHPGLDDSWFKGNRDILLSGLEFIPLRRSIRRITNIHVGKNKKIVVFGGGTDPFGFAQEIASVLRGVVGFSSMVFFSKSKDLIESLDPRYVVLDFGSSLDSEIDSAHLILTTASTSCFEVLARGLRLGVACAVENQISNYKNLEILSLAVPIGERISTGKWDLDSEKIKKLILDSNLLTEARKTSGSEIDFLGASRIVDAILAI